MTAAEQPLEVGLSVEGGLVALGRGPLVLHVSSDRLAPEQRARLRSAVDAVLALATPGPPLSGMPDVRVYRLQLPGRVVVVDDVTATPEERELVALVQALAASL